jgi:hypothetical protein
MNKFKLLPVILALSSLTLGACAPLKHHYREGVTSDELLNKLEPPTRVNQSVNGVEVWEYDETDLLNSGTFLSG